MSASDGCKEDDLDPTFLNRYAHFEQPEDDEDSPQIGTSDDYDDSSTVCSKAETP